MERIIYIVLPAIPQTLVMVLASTIIALLIGLPLGIILTTTRPGGLTESTRLYSILDGIINILRSFPFVILMIVVFPLSRLIVGSSIAVSTILSPWRLSM